MYAESKPKREHLNLEENCLQAFDQHCALGDKSEGRYGLKSVANSGHILKAEVGSLHLPWSLSSVGPYTALGKQPGLPSIKSL